MSKSNESESRTASEKKGNLKLNIIVEHNTLKRA